MPPANRISQSPEDVLRNAQLEPALAPDPMRVNTGSRNQEHANRGAQHETGVRTEQLLAFEVAEEEAIARNDEASEARFRRFLQEERRERPTTSSMEIAYPCGHSNDGTTSTEHASTVTPSMRSTQNAQSYGHGTEMSGTAEHNSTVPSNTDDTSVTDADRPDEVMGEPQIANSPVQDDITLEHIYIPPTPPNIVEQAFRFADNSDVILTDEEYVNFERQPFEAQRHTLHVFFRELVNMDFEID